MGRKSNFENGGCPFRHFIGECPPGVNFVKECCWTEISQEYSPAGDSSKWQKIFDKAAPLLGTFNTIPGAIVNLCARLSQSTVDGKRRGKW